MACFRGFTAPNRSKPRSQRATPQTAAPRPFFRKFLQNHTSPKLPTKQALQSTLTPANVPNSLTHRKIALHNRFRTINQALPYI